MPEALERAKRNAVRRAEAAERYKWGDQVLGQVHDPMRPRVAIGTSGSAPGRPQIRFLDVGGRWVDQKDQARRAKAATHRALLRAQRREGSLRGLARGSKAMT